MTKATTRTESRRADGRALARASAPLGVSLVVHVLAALALLSVAWSVGTVRPSGAIDSRPIVLSVDPAPPAPARGASAGAAALSLSPAPASSAPLPALDAPVGSIATPRLRSLADAAPLGDPREWSGVPMPDAPAPVFAGVDVQRAASVVYVVDASGAMVTSLKFVLAELVASVSRLAPTQRFQVVLFRALPGDDEPSRFEVFESGRSLLPATPEHKARLAAWVEQVTAQGRSNPHDGLRRALALEPDAIFLLSRSIRRSTGDAGSAGTWGRGMDEILAELERLNPPDARGRRRVVIKTIQFIDEDPTGIMQAIGRAHGDGGASYVVRTLDQIRAR